MSTTAAVSGPITVCLPYPDADNDGIVDATSPAIDENTLTILHNESGIFVDRTVSRDPVGNKVCTEVGSLSQFALGTGVASRSKNQSVCRGEVRKRLSNFFKAKLAALQQCVDGVNAGKVNPPCPDAKAAAAIVRAASKVDPGKIGKKCPADVIATLGLGGSCAGAANANDLSTCIVTQAGAAVDAVLGVEYGQPNTVLPTAAELCQAAIAKAAGKQYANSWLKIFSDCHARKDKGRVASCLDAAGQTKLRKAISKVERAIANNCIDVLVPVVKAAGCTGASTVADMAACQVTAHDAETAKLMSLLP